jgi:hypothetical protein
MTPKFEDSPVVYPRFEYRWQVEAQLAAFQHERKGAPRLQRT